jgi:hypothetical protein
MEQNLKKNIYFEKIDGGEVKLKPHIEVVAPEPVKAVHEVKSWSHFFQAIKAGDKLHDLRKNDRDYHVGDILVLREYDFINGRYTGHILEAVISYITDNRTPCAFSSAVLAPGYCILSLKVIRDE